MLPKRIFITGTGTDVGKTVISAALALGLLRRGIKVTYWKPVQAGQPEDAEMVRRICGTTLKIHPKGFTYEMS